MKVEKDVKQNVHRFVKFMIERENIRLKKEAGGKWPWTKDPILQKYKFTNVHRSDDRTSRVLQVIYDANAGAGLDGVIFNAAKFRWFGTWEMAEATGWTEAFAASDRLRLRQLATARLAAKQRVFTGAYVVTNGGVSCLKQEYVVDYVLRPLWERRHKVADAYLRRYKWEDAARELSGSPGFGGSGFMAKETLQDCLMHAKFSQCTDRDTWTPVGPGARRGLNRILGLDYAAAMREPVAIAWICDLETGLRTRINRLWPAHWTPLTAHDVQFQLCEFDKYERVRLGQGEPRSLYKQGGLK